MAHGRKIAVIGLGYVGLPVAVSFARSGVPVIGFDVDARRVAELREGKDRTCEVEGADLRQKSLIFTADPLEMGRADFFIVTVPTPIDDARRPFFLKCVEQTCTVSCLRVSASFLPQPLARPTCPAFEPCSRGAF